MRLHSILVLFAMLFLLGDCKKFDEDGFISLRRPFKRLEGTWKIDKVFVNGKDMTSTYKDTLLQFSIDDIKMDFRNKKENKDKITLVEFYGNEEHLGNFNYNLISQNETLSLYVLSDADIENPNVFGKLNNLIADIWKISKLYRGKLHLKSTLKSSYEIYLEKK